MKRDIKFKKYKYPNCDTVFELIKIKRFIYIFKCGHWCTDSVFEDLIDVETGVENWKNKQLKLF